MKFYNQDRNFKGEYIDSKFYIPASAVITMTHDPDGWAIHREVVNHLFLLGCEQIIITDREDHNKVYIASFEFFKKNAALIDCGEGEGLMLPLQYWDQNQV